MEAAESRVLALSRLSSLLAIVVCVRATMAPRLPAVKDRYSRCDIVTVTRQDA